MAINATEKPLGKVFTPDYQLSIPSFQRAYIWKPENILQLISDLEEACKSPETPYFLGSLILVRGRRHQLLGHRRPAASGLAVNHHRRAARPRT